MSPPKNFVSNVDSGLKTEKLRDLGDTLLIRSQHIADENLPVQQSEIASQHAMFEDQATELWQGTRCPHAPGIRSFGVPGYHFPHKSYGQLRAKLFR